MHCYTPDYPGSSTRNTVVDLLKQRKSVTLIFSCCLINRLFRLTLFLTLLVNGALMIVICSSISGYFTHAFQVTYSHYNRLKTHYHEYTPLKQGDCTVETAVATTASLRLFVEEISLRKPFCFCIVFLTLCKIVLLFRVLLECNCSACFKMCTD